MTIDETRYQNPITVENKYLYNGKELQSDEFGEGVGLDWYDYGARMFDTSIGRWSTKDNLSENYENVSIYAYALNNPIIIIDPDGNDIIILLAANNVGGLGHAAILVGNDKDGWLLFSNNGTEKSPGSSGPSNDNPESEKPFNSLEEFANDKSNFNEDGSQKYTNAILFKTNSETDKRVITAAKKRIKEDYNVLGSNCVDVCSDALKESNLDKGYTYSDPRGPKLSPVPYVRYKRIKENNEGEIDVSDRIQPKKEVKLKNLDEYYLPKLEQAKGTRSYAPMRMRYQNLRNKIINGK